MKPDATAHLGAPEQDRRRAGEENIIGGMGRWGIGVLGEKEEDLRK
jgi:hypothetical protein